MMAHYARLNEHNIVEEVVVIPNEVEPTEQDGINYLVGLFGFGNWKKTSYTASIRKNYAGRGFAYDFYRDAFIPPRPFPTWTLDEATCRWLPPQQMPDDGRYYRWDDFTQTWVLLE
jgi:hypothetical protein